MTKWMKLLALTVGAILLASCGGGGDGDDTATLRVLHAVPDAPDVNVVINGRKTFSEAPYKTGSAFVSLDARATPVVIEGILPDRISPVLRADVELDNRTENTLIALGRLANIEPLLIKRPLRVLTPGQVRVEVVHAAPSAPPVDVYVTAPDAALVGPLGSFAFKGTLGPVDIGGGVYQIRVTPAGNPAVVVFDSGPVDLPRNADLLLAAVDNTGPGDSPISLVSLDGGGSSEILDVNTPANLRVVHASPDAPPVDVVVNDDFAAPLIRALAFPLFTPYVGVPPGDYNIKVTAANNPGAIVIDTNTSLAQGVEYSVLAVGPLASIEPLVLVDDNRPVATEAKVRIVHASPSAGLVDIYITPPDTNLQNVIPTLQQVPFKADTGYIPLIAGRYAVTVTQAGAKAAAIGPLTIDAVNGGVYTAIARDATGGGLPLDVILLDDFN